MLKWYKRKLKILIKVANSSYVFIKIANINNTNNEYNEKINYQNFW